MSRRTVWRMIKRNRNGKLNRSRGIGNHSSGSDDSVFNRERYGRLLAKADTAKNVILLTPMILFAIAKDFIKRTKT